MYMQVDDHIYLGNLHTIVLSLNYITKVLTMSKKTNVFNVV